MSIVKPNEVMSTYSVSSTVLSTSPALIHVTLIKYSLKALFVFYLHVNEMEVQSVVIVDLLSVEQRLLRAVFLLIPPF